MEIRSLFLRRCFLISSLAFGCSVSFANEKYKEATQEEKEKIKADFITKGVLPPGCSIYADAIFCAGPQGNEPAPVSYKISTPRAKSGSPKSFMQSVTSSHQISVSSEEMKEGWNQWYKREPERARAWINRNHHVIRDFNRNRSH